MLLSTYPIFEKCHAYTEADDAQAEGLYPYFRPLEKARGTRVIIHDKELVMFGSNNYLGLAQDERVKEVAIKAIEEYGTSCSGSRLINGTLDLHEQLEHKLAEFTGYESALCFTTGYTTNLGSISALIGRGEHIISDKYNHASIMDGIFLARGFSSGIQLHRYKHNDIQDLARVLGRIPENEGKIIVTDGVFSMEGDIARFEDIRNIATEHNTALYLDEAHALGVIGKTGRGTIEHYNLSDKADLVMCTFSKSFGSIGGFIAGPRKVVDYIKHISRPLIFSASMPPANVASVLKTLDIIGEEPERVQKLQENADYMLKGFTRLGFDIGTAETPIIPILTGTKEQTLAYWKALFNRGIYVNPVLPPAVPPNRCLIRTSYMAIHERDELDYLLDMAVLEADKLGIPRKTQI